MDNKRIIHYAINQAGWNILKQVTNQVGEPLATYYWRREIYPNGNTGKVYLKFEPTHWRSNVEIYDKLEIESDDCIKETKMIRFRGNITSFEQIKTITETTIK
jgi:hypothetical protein